MKNALSLTLSEIRKAVRSGASFEKQGAAYLLNGSKVGTANGATIAREIRACKLVRR